MVLGQKDAKLYVCFGLFVFDNFASLRTTEKLSIQNARCLKKYDDGAENFAFPYVTGGGNASTTLAQLKAVDTFPGNLKHSLGGTNHTFDFTKYAVAASLRPSIGSTVDLI